jgi:CRP-like cAMP-binding protein
MEKYISHNFIEWTMFKAKLKVERYKRGQTVQYMGDVCKKLSFINSGLARAYIIGEDGKDYTWSIFFNDENSHMTNLFVVDYESFVNQTPSNLAIEVIEDCELFVIEYRDLQFLYDKLKKGERFGRLMSQEAYSYLHKKIINRQLKTAKERFEEFMATTPHLLEKVPQYHIATFLGITPQHLSRLKKSLRY